MFSDGEESTSTETELDNDDASSENESPAVEPVFEIRQANLIRNLESHLLYILRDNLDLATRLIPEFHRRIYIQFFRNGEDYRSAASHEHTSYTSPQGQPTTSSNSSTNASPNVEPLKRGRGSEKDEEDNGEGSKRPRREPGKVPEDFPGSISGLQPTFACHFHKLNPSKYGGSPWADRRFRYCPVPRPTELRRMKYFYLSLTHQVSKADIVEGTTSKLDTDALNVLGVIQRSTALMSFLLINV
jgi:hypothetical protein